jgi:metal-dependent amidase/aminoacylase/carboxypeptidase family protein
MLDDGLFKRFPRPDYAFALHCSGTVPHGQVSYTEGLALANVDSVDIIVKGKGGHGSAPHTTIDPVVLAARSIHGGTKHNIIPNEVKLQITVRSTKDSVRKHILEAIERIAKSAAKAARAPEPDVRIDPGEFTPALTNEAELTRKTVGVFKEVLGNDNVFAHPPLMGGEDFSRYGREGVPIFLYWLGTVPPEKAAEARKEGGKQLPSLHSDLYHPIPEPSIKTGVLTMTTAVLNLVGK